MFKGGPSAGKARKTPPSSEQRLKYEQEIQALRRQEEIRLEIEKKRQTDAEERKKNIDNRNNNNNM